MRKKGELSKLSIGLLVCSLIIILGMIIWIILRSENPNNPEVFNNENLDLKISQVKKINDNTLDLTLKRNSGEGEFVGLSFAVSDGSTTEIIKVKSSIPENQENVFSLKFISLNTSKIKKISVTPIYINEQGIEVIGSVKDEYITPNMNTCSNYCPSNAQCGFNDCGIKCGNGCDSGYLCLNYKCIKQQTSSGGSGGGSSSSGSSGGGSSEEGSSDSGDSSSTPDCTDTCSSLEYACGVQTICGKSVNCGTCKSGEYCSNGVCLLNVTGNTYFVATNGNDAWSGNFTHPWATWEKAFTSSSVNPGDIVYFRGGIYQTTVKTGLGIQAARNGTENNWITYMNYPGEIPVLDCGNIVQSDIQYTGLRNIGLDFEYIYYVKLAGLTVRNVKQYYNRNYGVGIRVSGGNMILERCTVYNIWGHGFETKFGEHTGDKVYFINCDAYNCNDALSGDPLGSNAGNTGAGFSLWDRGTNALGEVHLYNCRAWNCSDQGFQTGASNYVKAVGCWSFENREYVKGRGAGWKMGWMDNEAAPKDYINNLAACNDGDGYMTNEWYGVDIPLTYFYHNLAYKNGRDDNEGIGILISRLQSGYSERELLRILKNTISYDNNHYDIFTRQSALYTHEYNSWDSPVNVTDDDFVSLDCSQLYSPRELDGSLPKNVTFGHLAQGSDLIDAGVLIPGYHCSTAGAHPGENCAEWYGSAPDLGPFESNY